MKGLKDKIVLITGGASGIGYAMTKRFLEEGSRVVVMDKDEEGLSRLKSEMPELTQTIVVDVSKSKNVENAFKELDSVAGGPDILINNAGISIRHAFLDITPEEWRRVHSINLDGVFYIAQQAAKRMLERGSGVIINMGSTNGLTGYKFYSDYNASKAGVIELTRSMALEFAPDIRVNAVCPGYILTPMQEAEYTPEMLEEINRILPLRRHGKPEEVASLFAFLSSDEAAYITGQHIIMDGGELAGGLCSR